MSALIDSVVECFTECTTIPAEQFEFYIFQPLYESQDDVYWSDEEEDGSEDGESTPGAQAVVKYFSRQMLQHHVCQIPKKSALEKAFDEASGFAPSREDEETLNKYNDAVRCSDLETWLQTIQHREDTPRHLQQVFRRFDNEGQGRLTKRQITVILTSHGGREVLEPNEVERLLKKFGKDKDKYVAYDELCEQVLQPDT